MENDIRKYEPFFGEWKIEKELGHGVFGKVYEIYKEAPNGKKAETSCLKFVHMPTDKRLKDQMTNHSGDLDLVRRFLRVEAEEKLNSEIEILQDLRGTRNVLYYEEHMRVDNVGEHQIGWELLLRTELLYSLEDRFSLKNATQYDAVLMGLHLLSALSICEQKKILHRDIKPANVMVDKNGNYKLTDFGEAIYLNKKQMTSSQVGSTAYMAPEVYEMKPYDHRIDQYSLGLVIYFYLNKQRRWFCADAMMPGRKDATERATERRLSGEKLPLIEDVSPELNAIIQKMTAFDPDARYRHAQDAYMDLLRVMRQQEKDLKRKYLNREKVGISRKVLMIAGATGVVALALAAAATLHKPKQVVEVKETPKQIEVESNAEISEVMQTEEAAPQDISNEFADISLSQISVSYNGKSQRPAVTVKYKGETLTEGEEFTVDYNEDTYDWVNSGKHVLTCYGIHDYEGSRKAEFEIKPINIEKALIIYPDHVYADGKTQKPAIEVNVKGEVLSKGTDYTVEYGEGDWTSVGEYTFTIRGIGNYVDSVEKVFVIDEKHVEEKNESTDTAADGLDTEQTSNAAYGQPESEVSAKIDLSEVSIILSPSSVEYDGDVQKPKATLKYEGKELEFGKDYFIDYDALESDWTNAGTHTLNCIGQGEFSGEETAEFTITETSMKNAAVTYQETAGYNGQVQKPEVSVVLDDVVLENEKDIQIEYGEGDWKSVGDYTFTVKGAGNYKDFCERDFSILKVDISSDAECTLVSGNQKIFDGHESKPTVKIMAAGVELTEGTDYEVDYNAYKSDWTNVGVHTVVVNGINNYSGSLEKQFEITRISLDEADVEYSNTSAYTAGSQRPDIHITLGDVALEADRDYTVEAGEGDWIGIGEYQFTVHGINNYEGDLAETFVIEPLTIEKENIQYETSGYYSKESQKPEDVKVQVGDIVLKKGADYEISYQEDEWIDEGTYHFTVSGINNFVGEVECEYTIELSTEEIARRERLQNTYAFGMFESPDEGENINGSMRCKGWILTNEQMGDFRAYADIVSAKGVEESLELKISDMKESDFGELRDEHEEDVIAARGFNVKCSENLKDLEAGQYSIVLRVDGADMDEDIVLDERHFGIEKSDAKMEDLEALLGDGFGGGKAFHVDEDKKYSIGLELEDGAYEDNGKGVTLTGWFNAPEGSSVGILLEVGENGAFTVYNDEELKAKGGSIQIDRAERLLKNENAQVNSESTEMGKENGLVIQLSLPFLSEGDHEVTIQFNVGVGGESDIVRMQTITIKKDTASDGSFTASNAIIKEWEREFPKSAPKEEEKETEVSEGGQE